MAAPLSAFPPSFDGNPWTYGFALFSLTLVSAMSLAQVLAYVFEERRQREIDRQIHNAAPAAPMLPMSTLMAFRRIVFSFLLMAFLGAAPDAVILLLWTGRADATMEWLYFVDRICDGLVMMPFCSALWLLARTRQALPQALAMVVNIPLGPFRWRMLAENVKIVGAVLVIAIGVTLGKASV